MATMINEVSAENNATDLARASLVDHQRGEREAGEDAGELGIVVCQFTDDVGHGFRAKQ